MDKVQYIPQKNRKIFYGKKAENLNSINSFGIAIPITGIIGYDFLYDIIEEIGGDIEDIDFIKNFLDCTNTLLYNKLKEIVTIFLKTNSIQNVVIRSSHIYEDDESYSFPGIFKTILNVKNISDIIIAIINCWRGSFDMGAQAYCEMVNIKKIIPCSVIIQEFIKSKKSGVLFKSDNKIIINSTFGLAKTIVDGFSQGDVFLIENDSKVNYVVNNKDKTYLPVSDLTNPYSGDKIFYLGDEYEVLNSPPDSTLVSAKISKQSLEIQSISNLEIYKLIENVKKISDCLNVADYDVEWTVDGFGNMFILQFRSLNYKLKLNGINFNQSSLPLVSGKTRGRVMKVNNEDSAKKFKEGCILACTRLTGSTILAARKSIGCILESKSVLSHSAIIARELGKPAIGAVDLSKIIDGQVYEIDGSTGEIYGLEEENHYPQKQNKKSSLIRNLSEKDFTELMTNESFENLINFNSKFLSEFSK